MAWGAQLGTEEMVWPVPIGQAADDFDLPCGRHARATRRQVRGRGRLGRGRVAWWGSPGRSKRASEHPEPSQPWRLMVGRQGGRLPEVGQEAPKMGAVLRPSRRKDLGG